MKFILNFPKIVPILLLALVLSSCSNDDNNNQSPQQADPNIVELAVATPDLSSLVAALQAADGDLVSVLNGTGPFTVLAPTNDAFNTFLADNGFASLSEVPTDVLAQILLNHVIPGEITSTALTGLGHGYANTSADGVGGNKMSIYFDTANGVRFNNVASVISGGADIEATNGIVHIVDAVIGLPSIVDFALADPAFEALVSALTRDDLTFDYVTTLSTPNGTSPAPFTVFAPTNTAFGDLLAELGVNSLSDIDEPTLKATLDYHAVAAANVISGDLSDNLTVGTLGGNITANISGGATLTDANNRISNIIAVDVQAVNGIIHVIDKVILPPLQ